MDVAGRAFLNKTPLENGVPVHMFTSEIQHAQGAPPTRETFAALMAKQGFRDALATYQALRKQSASFELSAGALNDWGYALLLDHADPKAAIAILKLATELYSTDWNAFDSLAEAYEIHGEQTLATEHYQRSLDLNPKNENAVEHLKTLRAGR
jgi:tetratricopeptide (TPR) repeat protein